MEKHNSNYDSSFYLMVEDPLVNIWFDSFLICYHFLQKNNTTKTLWQSKPTSLDIRGEGSVVNKNQTWMWTTAEGSFSQNLPWMLNTGVNWLNLSVVFIQYKKDREQDLQKLWWWFAWVP